MALWGYDNNPDHSLVDNGDHFVPTGNAADATPDTERASSDPYYQVPTDKSDDDFATMDANPADWNN